MSFCFGASENQSELFSDQGGNDKGCDDDYSSMLVDIMCRD